MTEHAHRHILRNPPRNYHLNRMARCIDTITDVTLFLCIYVLLFLAETSFHGWIFAPNLIQQGKEAQVYMYYPTAPKRQGWLSFENSEAGLRDVTL